MTTSKHTFTVFCTDDSDTSTMWISAVEAETPDEAAKLGRNQCADEWGYAGDDVTVVGVALGDIDIIGWDDDGNCLAEIPRMNKFWAPPVPDPLENFNVWDEHPDHPLTDWQHEASENYTRLGYWSWVRGRIESEA